MKAKTNRRGILLCGIVIGAVPLLALRFNGLFFRWVAHLPVNAGVQFVITYAVAAVVILGVYGLIRLSKRLMPDDPVNEDTKSNYRPYMLRAPFRRANG